MHATHLSTNKIFDFHSLSISVAHLHLVSSKILPTSLQTNVTNFQNHKYEMYLLFWELLSVHTVLEHQITLLLKHQTNLEYTKYTFIDFHTRSHITALIIHNYKCMYHQITCYWLPAVSGT